MAAGLTPQVVVVPSHPDWKECDRGLHIPKDHSFSNAAALPHGETLGLGVRSRVLHLSSYAIDVSIGDYLTTLLAGGCVCIPSETDRKERLGDYMVQSGVNFAILTPSVSRLLSPEDVSALEVLCLIGEPMAKSDVLRWAGRTKLVNTYGPVECSAISMVQSHITISSEPGDIGFATGCACWVTHQDDPEILLRPEETSELLIEGPIVGRHYLNEPEQSAAVFVRLPAWLREVRPEGYTGRLCRTGDLVLREPDSSLRYIGRRGNQIKVNGQRVELGEVGGSQPHVDGEVMEHLRSDLPQYMIPGAFVELESIPLTTTGNADRRRLRQVYKVGCYRKHSMKQQSLAAMEARLQQIVSKTLGLPHQSVYMNESFADLGGDSIRA
ncbi:hypothetical protein BDV30DRAFT_237294 [Aspergillus minisclerotigenes]|uniref:Carrier domain-containing protein n=1 Tax=Aspergillus minisclerotigenes TaxID=656917 RepID=A0A5N6J716_9EURO|nr:hypothetical protein BDV30DRAFT_237294 [Aspergillus minisclerotigenes]